MLEYDLLVSPGTDPAVVGDYPQTEPGDEEALFQLGESEGLDPDGFLTVPVPEQRLLPTALWTDVLKAGLPASWSAGHLFNESALSVFRQSDLGRFREYPAVVRDQSGSPRTLTYLHIRNIIEPVAEDLKIELTA